MPTRQVTLPAARRGIDAGRRLFRAAIAKSRGRSAEPLVQALHDTASRVLRLAVDPVDHVELDDARAAFAGARLAERGCGEPRVLMMSQRAWASHTATEVTLAAALSCRGASVTLLTCGGGLPVCEVGRPSREIPKPCRDCAGYQAEFLGVLDLDVLHQRDFVSDEERDLALEVARGVHDMESFEAVGLPIGRMVRPSVAWTLRDAYIQDSKRDRELYQEFLATGTTMALAADRILDRVQPDVVIATNGTFIEERVLCELARKRGIDVITYEAGPTVGTLLFSRTAAATEYDITELWKQSGSDELTEEENVVLDNVLLGRERGVGVHAGSWARPDPLGTRARLGINASDRLVTIFPNVGWDTAAFERGEALCDDMDFVSSLISIAARSDDRFVIRIHPGETLMRSRRPLARHLERNFTLSSNVTLLGPADATSSYSLIQASNLVVAYTSTIGLEAAARGRPVVVGARTHYAKKGFTWDVEDRDQLERWVADGGLEMSDEMISLARRYAYLFFCRALLPFPPVAVSETGTRLTYADVDDLLPGRDPSLDLICDAIIDGTKPFVAPS